MLAASLEDHFITVINALPTLAAEMTETEKIPPLLDESRKIAQQFWMKLNGAKEYPTGRPVPIERERLFSSMGKQRIYLSEAARSGPASFPKFIRGEAELADPRPLDVLTRLPLLLPLTSKDPLSRWWRVGYALLFLVSFGLITLISDLLGEPTGLSPAVRLWLSTDGGPSWGWVILRLVLAIVVVLLVRVWAYVVWALMQRKTVFGT